MIEFELSEYQELLRNAAREFFIDRCPVSLVREMETDMRGYLPELWQEMASLGWLGLALPEEFGGGGGSFVDLTVLLEETGRVLLPSPFFSTVVLGALAILFGGSERQKQDLLPKIASGEVILTMALHEPGSYYNIRGVKTLCMERGNRFAINGTKLFVLYAHVADYIICVARNEDEQINLLLVNGRAEGVKKTYLNNIASEKQFEVLFKDVALTEADILGDKAKGNDIVNRLFQYAAVAKCAEMVGGGQRVKEMCVEYAKQRIQFGKPIGSFQFIQGHLANMSMDLEGARLATYQAAWLLDNRIKCAKEVAAAKAWTNEVYKRIVGLGHQIHGGYSITMDHNMQLYFRRAKAAELSFGDTNYCLNEVARELLAPWTEKNSGL
jgi:alkylation response protein AidB-like acyl-CoA dehydrogenase